MNHITDGPDRRLRDGALMMQAGRQTVDVTDDVKWKKKILRNSGDLGVKFSTTYSIYQRRKRIIML